MKTALLAQLLLLEIPLEVPGKSHKISGIGMRERNRVNCVTKGAGFKLALILDGEMQTLPPDILLVYSGHKTYTGTCLPKGFLNYIVLAHQLRAKNLGLWLPREEQPKHVCHILIFDCRASQK